MKVQVNRQLLKLFAALLVLAAVLAAVFAVLRRWEAGDRVQTPPSQEPDRPLTYYEGAWYAPKEELETVLVMGLDKREQGETRTSTQMTSRPTFSCSWSLIVSISPTPPSI